MRSSPGSRLSLPSRRCSCARGSRHRAFGHVRSLDRGRYRHHGPYAFRAVFGACRRAGHAMDRCRGKLCDLCCRRRLVGWRHGERCRQPRTAIAAAADRHEQRPYGWRCSSPMRWCRTRRCSCRPTSMPATPIGGNSFTRSEKTRTARRGPRQRKLRGSKKRSPRCFRRKSRALRRRARAPPTSMRSALPAGLNRMFSSRNSTAACRRSPACCRSRIARSA